MASEISYFNGVFAPSEELSVPLFDRGFIFGDGIYEVVLTFNGVPFGLEEHLDRFYNGMRFMRLPEPFATREELKRVIAEGIERVEGGELMIYWQLTRGAAPRKHAFPEGARPNFMMNVRQAPDASKMQKEGIRAVLAEDIRWRHCDIKTINLIPAVLATQNASENGADEAILHRDGFITEGASSNVFFVVDGGLRTTPLSGSILGGITRSHVFQLAKKLGIKVSEELMSRAEITRAQEIFITSVARRVIGVTHVDGRPVGGGIPGPVTVRLQNAYKELVAETCGI